jgi:hypothetical protein
LALTTDGTDAKKSSAELMDYKPMNPMDGLATGWLIPIRTEENQCLIFGKNKFLNFIFSSFFCL